MNPTIKCPSWSTGIHGSPQFSADGSGNGSPHAAPSSKSNQNKGPQPLPDYKLSSNTENALGDGGTTAGFANDTHYGSYVSMKDALAVSDEQVKKPEVNKGYIQSTAETKGAGGEAEIRNYQALQFNAQNAELLEKCKRLSDHLDTDVAGITRHINELSTINEATERYQESIGESLPWTRFARVQVMALGIFSALLLLVGINTIAQVLIASGIPGFDSAWRAYLFSLTPVGVAFALKALRTFIVQRTNRLAYTVSVWVSGLFFGVLWILLFAKTFPALTQTTADIINSLSQNPGDSGPGHPSGVLFISVSILAESLLAAGCGLTIETIVEKHQPSAREDNPAYLKTQADLDHWLSRRAEQQEIAGKIAGKLRAIEEARKQFIEEGIGYFGMALAAAAQSQQLGNLFNS